MDRAWAFMANKMRDEIARAMFPERLLVCKRERDLNAMESHNRLCRYQSLCGVYLSVKYPEVYAIEL